MPGTVQVSILELTGLPSSRSSSSMTIKVSLGKHTCEAEGANGDFLLPLATLRDNLVVKVHDNEGNEIAHTGVKSRLIAEKGSWDDLFPLEGGGHVHMRLKFSLSEEERVRIRNMRESALKKKQDELLNKNKSDLQAAVAFSGGRNEMFSTAAISCEAPSIDLSLEASSKTMSSKSSSEPSNSSASIQAKEDDPCYILKEQNPLEELPSNVKEDDPSYNLKEQSTLEKPRSKVKEDEPRYNLKEQSPLEKPPSKVKEDPLYNLKKQSPSEKTPSKVKEDDLHYNLKEQSPLEKTPSKVKEDDLHHNLKEQNPLENTPSKAKEGDLHYNLKEKNKLKQTPSEVKEDDPCYNFKEQSPMENPPTKVKEDDQHHNLKEQSTLEIPPGKIKEVDWRHKLKEQSPLEKPPSKVKEEDLGNKLKEQTPLEKIPSKVRKTVAAFESSLQSQGWMAAAKTRSGRETTDAHFKEESSESISAQNVKSLEYHAERVSKKLQELPTSTRGVREPIENRSTSYEPKDVDNMEQKSKEISAVKELKGKDPLDNILESKEREPSNELRRTSNLEQYKTSGRVLDSLSDESQLSSSVTEQEYASGDHLKNPCGRMSAEVPSIRCSCLCRTFHGWIFLEEAVCSCIAKDNRMVIDLFGCYTVNPKTYSGKLVDDEVTSSKEINRSANSKKPESSHSSGDGASRGPNGHPGQVMKIVIMVGFGLLVLFTRKRKPR